MNRAHTWRRQVGCWLNERWRTECALSATLSRITGIQWQDLHNRIECLREGGDAVSRTCHWMWTSELTVCRVFPGTAVRLCRRCFLDWPLGGVSADGFENRSEPRISVIITVGGELRSPALMAVLSSLLTQTMREFEVIVVEQSNDSTLAAKLPPGVRYRCFPEVPGLKGFNKSRLMNEGVRLARAPWVLLHDADIMVPGGYLEAILARAKAGWEAVRPIRFLFYLDSAQSDSLAAGDGLPSEVEQVIHNFPGGSTAMRRDMYWMIGGHDERFCGWGGEDSEFMVRLRTCRLFPGHYAPAFHLWHPPAPEKQSGDRNQALLDQQMALPVEDRIRRLQTSGLDVDTAGGVS